MSTDGDAGAPSRTRFEIAHLQVREGLSEIREMLGIEIEPIQEKLDVPLIKQTIKAQVFSHIEDMEHLANNVQRLADDVREIHKGLRASPVPQAMEP
jgi:hypothetical protein